MSDTSTTGADVRGIARFSGAILLGALLLGAPGCTREEPQRGQQPKSATAPSGATSALDSEDGEWRMPSKNYASTRFSALDQINRSNVRSLKLAWSFSTGVVRGHEAAPIVAGNTMFVITPFPNVLYALDLTQPGAPTKWVFRPKPSSSSQGVACCDVVNRGVAYDDGRIYMNTLDGRTICVDAETGTPMWDTPLGNINIGETITMAPVVAGGKVLVGNSGGEMGVRGWLAAVDAASGKLAWKAYSTGPDADCLIGADFKPHYASDRGKDLGVSSWPAGMWKNGGGTVWGWISYDPELNTIYYGTANPGPWNPEARPGDNKWTAGVFARRLDDGQALWFYQWSPHDLHDYDGINENVLLDLPIRGRTRKVIVRPERNGYVYVLDRVTGEVYSADPFAYITTTMGVDLKTGRPRENPATAPKTGVVVRNICPASPGAKDWQPSAYSPRTGLLYIPGNNLCQDCEGVQANYIAGTPYVGMNVQMRAGPGGHRGEFIAWNPIEGGKVWSIKERFPVWSGVCATGGDVVFYGTMEGWFKAVDARSGDVLWQFKCGSGIIGQPITYRGPDGRQYIAVLSGVGGWAGAVVSAGIDTRDSTAALGFTGAMTDLPQHTTRGGMLYVFSLP
jgi:lanthanide-dependent methanol dehydrogenase